MVDTTVTVSSPEPQATNSIRIGTVGTETIRIETVSMAVECDSSFSICFRFGISGPLAKVVTISVSATVKSMAVVSTIVSAVSKTVSVTVSVSTAVVSTIVGGGSFGISLGFGLGGHDGEKSNCENGEIFHVADYQAIGFVRRTEESLAPLLLFIPNHFLGSTIARSS